MIVYQKRDIRDWKRMIISYGRCRICWARRLFPRINSFVIEDSIFTKVLIVALTHSDKQRIVDKAYQILTKNVAFKQLQICIQ